MKSLQDALYNWLSIKVVLDARPDDLAAKETTDMFRSILEEDHGVSALEVRKEEGIYFVAYEAEGACYTKRFSADVTDCILTGINENPERYRNYE
ncbi:MAG: hypothetical protein ACI35R_03540 [Bacillus sp. (in: firmicutes)]